MDIRECWMSTMGDNGAGMVGGTWMELVLLPGLTSSSYRAIPRDAPVVPARFVWDGKGIKSDQERNHPRAKNPGNAAQLRNEHLCHQPVPSSMVTSISRGWQ